MDPIADRPPAPRRIGRILPVLVAVLVATAAPAPAAATAAPAPAAATAVPAPAAASSRQADGAGVRGSNAGVGDVAAFRASVPSPAAPTAPSTSGLGREVFGFLPYWELADPSLRLRYGLVSTIAYFSVGVGPDGTLQRRDAAGKTTAGWAGWTSARMTSIIRDAHRNRARVVLTLSMFAWTGGGAAAQARLLGDPVARRTLAREAARAVRDRGADGINLDFEPLVAGHEADFVALVRAIRAELDRTGRRHELTFDTMGRVGNYPIAAATGPGAADAVFVMAYDYRTAGSAVAGSIAPLAGPQYDLADTLLAYLAEIPASRIILGVGWYGRAWPTVSAELNASTQTDPRYGASVPVPYDLALGAAEGRTVRWDPTEATSWFAYRRQACSPTYGCVSTWRQVYYDDDRALRLKYDLVNIAGIRGVGIWALGFEGSLSQPWTAIADKFVRDTTPPRASIRVLSSNQRDEGFLVDWSGWDDRSGVAAYDVQVSVDGGPWRSWLSATGSGADVWLGHDGHAYAFRVRARDRRGNVGSWSSASIPAAGVGLAPGGFARVLAGGLAARDRPGPSGTPVDTLAAGTIVAITAGPVSSGGIAWVGVREPVAEWPPLALVHSGVWIPVSSPGAGSYLQSVPAPVSTRVQAGISGLAFGGAGRTSIGSTAAAVARRSFSPNGDGGQDTLRIDWHARLAFDSLTLRVLTPAGKLLGTRPVPARGAGDQSYLWDGAVAGRTLKDGRYVLQLVGKAAGAAYSAPSVRPATAAQVAAYAVTIDTVAPAGGRSSLAGRRLSPNGDGRHDAIVLTGSATGADRWSFTAAPIVAGRTGGAVRTMSGIGPSAKVTWDGRADDGSVVPDGKYRVTIRNLDWAGNGPSAAYTVPVDTRAPSVSLTATPPSISPDGDRVADRAALAWTSDERVAGGLTIARGSAVIRRMAIASAMSGRVAWDGRDAAGRPVPDGRYAVAVDLLDAAGNRAVARVALAVDRPVVGLGWSALAFDPLDGDALAATARLGFELTKSATVSLRIEDAGGRIVRNGWVGRRFAAGRLAWTWNGLDGHRTPVPAGRYVAVLTVTTSLGTTELRRPVAVDAFMASALPTTVKAGGFLTLVFRSVEPLRARPTVTVTQTGERPVRVTATAVGGGRYVATVRIPRAGPVAIAIAGRDSAGGVNVTRLATRAT